jgi:hypothetical protein
LIVRYLTSAAAVLALLACGQGGASGPRQPAPAGTPPATGPTTITVKPTMTMTVARYTPGESRYTVERVDTLTFQYPNSVQTQVVERSAWVRMSIAPGQSAAAVTMTVDSVRAGTVSRDTLRASDGFRWTAQLIDGRKLESLAPVRSDPTAEQLLSNSLSDILLALPAGGARGGFSWRDTLQVSERVAGAEIPTTLIRDVNARVQGSPAELLLETTATLVGKGTSARFGEEIDVTIQGARVRAHHLTPAGQVTSVEGRDSLALTFDVPSVGQTVPATQIGRITIQRISGSP